MNLYRLLTRDTPLPLRWLILAALASSIATLGVLALVNLAAGNIEDSGEDKVDWITAGAFVLALGAYAAGEVFLLRRFASHVEAAIDAVRMTLIRQVRDLAPETLDKTGEGQLFESITQSTHAISQNSQYIAIAFRSALLVIVLMGYILYLSMMAFVLVTVTVLIAGFVYHKRGKAAMEAHIAAFGQDQRLFNRITDLLDGWKEVRMFQPRRAALKTAYDAAVNDAAESRIEVQNRGFEQYIFGQVAFYFLLGVVVFVAPSYTEMTSEDLSKISTAVLFIIAPIGLVIQSVAVLGASEAAAGRTLALSAQLKEQAAYPTPRPNLNYGLLDDFQEITFEGIEYEYPAAGEDRGFHLGPVSLSVKRGEILFISGGNGSGKSTLMRILTGLYTPHAGRIRVDNRQIGSANIREYRSLIASVLSDFHLFERLYGLDHVRPEEIGAQLRAFGLESVVRLEGDAFSSVQLSTGQRKRLALVVAILEDRPLIVLDEWAADQDPEFRKKFYRDILPMLRDQGKTIIAITHDDHYFDAGDRRVHLSEGTHARNGEGVM
ncbi:putative ATP-binding cassette transporter [Rubricella aquisinus]|uniref:Putative ATP-binding cassette transporter n=1 Tax=Rubricella aquisinus TaxID=2028108 RepID=A0A840WYU9_9RHOB|nr:cyclic peptide export ABC transporter [Rubricella aquisinus]MBB5516320.1 putative ATP-binding cassette transporter [Rubricella aquisinus]